jgi:ribosome-binding protein aMBF1 (putative translation factor)
MPESLDALRQAAVTLLSAASPGAVLAATRALLADWEQNTAPTAAVEPLQAVGHSEELNTATPAPPPANAIDTAQTIPAQSTLAAAGAAYAAQRREEEAVWFSARPAVAMPDNTKLTAWEDLRQRVREARQARGLSIQDLAKQLGMARSTLENALQTRALPSMPTRTRLSTWLAAPEVAADETMFRGNGASHTAGSDDDVGHVNAGV